MGVLDTMKKAWNTFLVADTLDPYTSYSAPSNYGSRQDRPRLRYTNERSVITAILTRISVDAAGVPFRHILLDDRDRYKEDVRSHLNDCLTFEPNLDQGPRAFRQDIIMSLLDHGCIAIVPVDTTKNPHTDAIFDIFSVRVGAIVAWYPNHVKVNLYNEKTGKRQDVIVPKKTTAIIENPMYSVMNEPLSTAQRLIHKLGLLDTVDEASASGKLDLIIKLPYVVKSETRKKQAEDRRDDLEMQLKTSKYGIGYVDATENITQLNRPVENSLLTQIEYLVDLLYTELGITKEVMDGTANEATMINYYTRSIEPILDAVTEGMQRAFLGQSGLRRKERIRYFRDMFKLVPISQIAEIADKLARNEVLASNEIRGFMGVEPSTDPKADMLINSNMPQPGVLDTTGTETAAVTPDQQNQMMNDAFDSIDGTINEIFDSLKVDPNSGP